MEVWNSFFKMFKTSSTPCSPCSQDERERERERETKRGMKEHSDHVLSINSRWAQSCAGDDGATCEIRTMLGIMESNEENVGWQLLKMCNMLQRKHGGAGEEVTVLRDLWHLQQTAKLWGLNHRNAWKRMRSVVPSGWFSLCHSHLVGKTP